MPIFVHETPKQYFYLIKGGRNSFQKVRILRKPQVSCLSERKLLIEIKWSVFATVLPQSKLHLNY